jgi:hypothetical protein
MSAFSDEPTPLPAPATPQHDPRFPTGYVPRIDIEDLEEDPSEDGPLYPTWRFSSPCRTLDEVARLHAPHFDGNSMHLFTTDVRPAGETVELVLRLATGKRVLAGIATVVESLPDGDSVYDRPGMRFAFKSIDSVSAELLEELGENAAPIRELVHSADVALDGADTVPVRATSKPRDDATRKMSKIEISDVFGDDHDEARVEWTDLLMCTLEVVGETPRPHYRPPPATTAPAPKEHVPKKPAKKKPAKIEQTAKVSRGTTQAPSHDRLWILAAAIIVALTIVAALLR